MLSKVISWLHKENVASRAVQIISLAKVLRCLAGSLSRKSNLTSLK